LPSYAEKLTQLSDLRRELNKIIETQARAVAAARGTVLDFNPGTRYSRPLYFDKYSRLAMNENSGNTTFCGVDYPIAYPLGTPLIDVHFKAYVGDGIESMNVAFPESYLDDPSWEEKELPYIQAKQAKDS
jgi:hypothetical protein